MVSQARGWSSAPTHLSQSEWIPQGIDHLLLDVALNPTDRGRAAWHRLRPDLVFDDITGDQQRLMPLIHRSLTTLGIDDIDLGRMRGLHRNSWYRNQMLVSRVEPTILALTSAGIDVMVMKGLPLGLLYYPELGLRPMADADLLVPFSQYLAAIDVLQTEGFVVERPQHASFPMLRAASEAKHPNGTEIDLHWQVHRSIGLPGASAAWGPEFWSAEIADDDFWSRAQPFAIGSARCLAPSAEDLFLHVCVHNAYSPYGVALRWAVDAAMIIRTREDFDWQALIRRARDRRVLIGVRKSLQYLADDLGIPVPEDFRQELERSSPTLRDRYISRELEHPARLGWKRRNLVGFMMVTHLEPPHRVVSAFLVFVATIFGSGSVRRLPVDFIRNLKKRAKAFGRRRKDADARSDRQALPR